MIGYLFYFLLAVGLSILLTASVRRLRGDGIDARPPEKDAAFERRIAAIEERFGTAVETRQPRGEGKVGGPE